MDDRREIRLVAESMDIGETIRQVCPACGGGDKRERSLTITVFPNMVVKYHCFRESCIKKLSGSFLLNKPYSDTNSESSTRLLTQKLVRPKRKVFNGVTYPLTDFEKEWIWKAWGIQNPKYWYHTPQYGGRVAMSVRSPNYTPRGWVLRDLEGKATYKALTYVEQNHTPLSWYKSRGLEGTILVEDIPSAVRASKYLNSVALLGTGVGLDRATEIDISAPRPILIALDQDTLGESTPFTIKDRWGLLWGDVRIIPLKYDLKDLQEPDLEDLLLRSMA